MPCIIKMHEEKIGLLKTQNPGKWGVDIEDDNCPAREWKDWVRKSLDARVFGFYGIKPHIPSQGIPVLQNSLWKKSSLSPKSKNCFEFEFSQLSWYTGYESEQIMGTEAEVRKQLDYVVYYLSLMEKKNICCKSGLQVNTVKGIVLLLHLISFPL